MTMSRNSVMRAFPREYSDRRVKDAVGNHAERLVRVAALAQHDLLHLQLARYFGVLQGHARELRVVVPQAVIDGIVAGSSEDIVQLDARRR